MGALGTWKADAQQFIIPPPPEDDPLEKWIIFGTIAGKTTPLTVRSVTWNCVGETYPRKTKILRMGFSDTISEVILEEITDVTSTTEDYGVDYEFHTQYGSSDVLDLTIYVVKDNITTEHILARDQ